jgi:hypothetical protein
MNYSKQVTSCYNPSYTPADSGTTPAPRDSIAHQGAKDQRRPWGSKLERYVCLSFIRKNEQHEQHMFFFEKTHVETYEFELKKMWRFDQHK